MSWKLQILTLDVGQGESALVIVRNEASNQFKSMLIDAGLQRYGSKVDEALARHLGNRQLDYLVTSHYDVDHSGGITFLLEADNYSSIAYGIANAVDQAVSQQIANQGRSQLALLGSTVGAFMGYTGGAYDYGDNKASQELPGIIDACIKKASATSDVNAAFKAAWDEGGDQLNRPELELNKFLLKYINSRTPRMLANEVYASVVANLNNPNRLTEIYHTVFRKIVPAAKGYVSTRIGDTDLMRYAKVMVYDPGDIEIAGFPTASVPKAYQNAFQGIAMIKEYSSQSPLVGERTRITPGLGNELLGYRDTPNAPHVYCLAIGQQIYQKRNFITSQDGGNGVSIGLGFQFGKFAFFSGGDLPADGLEQIPGVFLRQVAFGNLERIAAFKAGHHGSAGALNREFLTAAKPKVSVISCGDNSFGHPSQAVINLLHQDRNIENFFLTNCKEIRTYVPASNFIGGRRDPNQLVPGIKSRVAGDNGIDTPNRKRGRNQFPKIHRGDIYLEVEEEGVSDAIDEPAFLIEYYEPTRDPNTNHPYGILFDAIIF